MRRLFFALIVSGCATCNAGGYLTLDSSLAENSVTLSAPTSSTLCRFRTFSSSSGWTGFATVETTHTVVIPTDTSILRLDYRCREDSFDALSYFAVSWEAGVSEVIDLVVGINGGTGGSVGGPIGPVALDLTELISVLDLTFTSFDLDVFAAMITAALTGLGIGVSGGMVYRAVRRA